MKKRHAYLIMAHHNVELVQEILHLIDDERNDIFLHIDAKSLHQHQWDCLHTQKSRIYRTPSISVNWGGYSQVNATLLLMETAYKQGNYSYYHFMTGASCPLKSQDDIHAFFDQHENTCFVACEKEPELYYDRVQFLHIFNESSLYHRDIDSLSWIDKYKRRFDIYFLKVQKKFQYDHFKQFHLIHKKGLAYWSLPHNSIEYILSQKKNIKKIFRYASPADESFVQTILFNSPFKDSLYNLKDEISENLIITTWPLENGGSPREYHAFTMDDWQYIHQPNKFFGLKFVGDTGLALIQRLKEEQETKKES